VLWGWRLNILGSLPHLGDREVVCHVMQSNCDAVKGPRMALLTQHTQACMSTLTMVLRRCGSSAAAGFVIVSACMRLLAERGWCVERLLRRFCNQVRMYTQGFKAQSAHVMRCV
jgi:hypothetical protein